LIPASPGDRPNLYEQQRRNRFRTVLIVVLFLLFLGFLGVGFDLYFFGSDPFGILGDPQGPPIGLFVAGVVGSISAIWGLNAGASAVLASSGAIPVPDNDPRYRTLINVVDEMSIASGLPRPKVYVIPDPDPNAFATGRNPETSSIAVTEGLLDALSREELQGVVAHELAHIRNYDIRVTTLVAALVGAAFLLADMGRRAMVFGGRGGGRKGGSKAKGGAGLIILIIWLVSVALAPFISRLLAMGVSRQREYLADATGAELTRNPMGLASALAKLNEAAAPTQAIKRGVAHLCIVDPLGRKMNFREGRLAELFGTHPPITKRITILKAMAYQHQ
jgi:heat shock protein HtpX